MERIWISGRFMAKTTFMIWLDSAWATGYKCLEARAQCGLLWKDVTDATMRRLWRGFLGVNPRLESLRSNLTTWRLRNLLLGLCWKLFLSARICVSYHRPGGTFRW
jgi:hypothetical protein